MKCLAAIAALGLLQTRVQAAVVDVWWNITYVQTNPDGLSERRVIGVNGTWPPPPIEVTRNDTLRVHAHNSLDVLTSLHHHGMFFNTTSYYDGAVGVTECGIPPGADQTYEVPVSDQWGTYWVHSHYSGQYVDGLRAPFLIHNSPEVHQYDEEYTVILSDWYHDQHSTLAQHFMSKANPTGAEPVPDSSLIYFTQNGTYLPGFNENSTLPFTPGKTYRLRVINQSAFAMFYFKMEGHQMRVIEVDGTDIEELPVDFLTLSVAQRYSVLVTAKNDTSTNYPIYANMDTDMFDTVPDSLQPNLTSTIVYSSGATTAASTLFDEYGEFPDLDMVPVIRESSAPAEQSIDLNVFFDTLDDGSNHAMFNNNTYVTPNVPSLFTQLSMGEAATDVAVYGSQSNAIVLDHMKMIQATVINWDAKAHPFHLHGHKFQIIARSSDPGNPNITENQVNPPRRDTVSVPSEGSVTLRWRADNPGTWFFHCHIDWHLTAGLAVVFSEAPLIAQQVTKPPQQFYDHCATLNTPFTGNAAGRNSTTDLSGAPYGPFPQKLGWHAKGIGALAGSILAALFGMAVVVWYGLGEQIDEEELHEIVAAKIAAKKARGGGLVKRGITAVRKMGTKSE